MPIGSLGSIVFTVSSGYVLTYQGLTRTAKARFADHQVVHGKPASEFTGTDLDDVRMSLTFNATLGVSPRAQTAALREMCESGNAWPLVIGADVWGNFTLREVSDDHVISTNGGPAVVSVDVRMLEYAESGAGNAALARDMSRRSVTGACGPEKVAGASAPLQTRTCTARK